MKVHEGLLEENHTRIYLGQVTKVSRSEKPTVTDYVDQELSPMEILFDVGTIIKEARAIPLDQTNEVVEGDFVIIFSFEHIYNSTYYYHSIRKMDRDNDTVYMKYGNSEVRLIPKSEKDTELLLAGGTSIISIDPTSKRINIESDSGGVNINSHSGKVNIENDRTSLKEILDKLMDAIIGLKVITTSGPKPLTPDSISKFIKISMEIPKLLGDMNSTSRFPNLPADTYTVEFAAEAVGELGIEFLNDHGDPDPSSVITNLQNKFPPDPDVPTNTNPIASSVTPGGVDKTNPTDELDTSKNGDIKLSPNFWLSDVTTKCTFPHKLKSQHGQSEDDLIKNLQMVALNILEPILAQYPQMKINSGFRGTPSIKGRVSQHEIGEAVDLQFPGMTPTEYLAASEWVVQNVAFDQFIFEHGKSIWFHISCKRLAANRAKTLTMLKGRYSSGITLHYT